MKLRVYHNYGGTKNKELLCEVDSNKHGFVDLPRLLEAIKSNFRDGPCFAAGDTIVFENAETDTVKGGGWRTYRILGKGVKTMYADSRILVDRKVYARSPEEAFDKVYDQIEAKLKEERVDDEETDHLYHLDDCEEVTVSDGKQTWLYDNRLVPDDRMILIK